MNGYLKRKAFAKGTYYIVNQTNLGDQPYNILERFKTLDSAEQKFNSMTTVPGYSKILVDGTSGKILQKDGPDNWVGQNLVYMYEHVQGKVYNGKFK